MGREMLAVLNIHALVCPPCPSPPQTLASATDSWRHERYDLPLPFVQQYLSLYRFPSPFLSLPEFPSPSTSHSHSLSSSDPFSSLPLPCPVPSALRLLLTLPIVSVIAVARTAPSTPQRSNMYPALIIIILVNHLHPIQWFTGQEVAWLVLPAAWQNNLCP